MSRAIKFGTEDIANVLADVRKALEKARLEGGKFSFTTTVGKSDEKARVLFSPMAWLKMMMLVREFTSEVGWYGVAERSEDEKGFEYRINDIMVYPQSVTGAYVDFDEGEVAKWMFDNREDERFDAIHMHGHSHVNMAVSPSSVDKTHYKTILDQLPKDGFYIFMIWNKSMQSYCEIYDLKHNILFEDSDVTMDIEGVDNLGDFMTDAKSRVTKKTFATYGGKDTKDTKPAIKDDIETRKKGKDSKKVSSPKRAQYSWDDYENGYWGGAYGIYDGCYSID